MQAEMSPGPRPNRTNWKSLVAPYMVSDPVRSGWQLASTILPLGILWYLMYRSLSISYWLTLALGLPAAGLAVRLFVLQHDCGHNSLFKTKQANNLAGMFCSVLTLVPYHYWKKSHAIHHAHASNLDNRGVGDVYTMTVQEYLQQPTWKQLGYRLYRNPFILFGIIPTLLFVVIYRIPAVKSKAMKTVAWSVHATNLAIAVLVGSMMYLVGWKEFLVVQAPITIISSSIMTWGFFVQHQFEDTYWDHQDNWDYTKAALQGSSYYKLPKVVQWFSANIGFHHIHHLSPRIPNYLLEKCHNENPLFQESPELTIRTSLKSAFLSLWDEEQRRLISFRELAARQRSVAVAGLSHERN